MKKTFLFLLFSSFFIVGFAQDPHYSQFFASPLTLNPALTGKFNGGYRLAGNFRNQWPSINNAFVTNTASIDFHVLQNKLSDNDRLGVGFTFLNDASANSAVKFNYASFSTAYHKGLDEEGNNQLSVGIQGTYANMLINTTNLKFEDQLTTLGFTGTTSEIFNNSTLQSNYLDINAGVLYSGSTGENNNFYAGFSLYHINRPSQKFTGTEYLLNSRFTIHGGGYYFFNENIGLHISALHSKQAKTSETVIGGTVEFLTNPDDITPTSFYAGAWLRMNDAFIPYIGVDYSNLRLGLTYDVNTSSLKTASNSRGGLEVSLLYTHPINTDRPIICPKF